MLVSDAENSYHGPATSFCLFLVLDAWGGFMNPLRSFLRLLALSRIGLVGAALATGGFLVYGILIAGDLFLFESTPIMGIVINFMLPGVAAFGLLLIPIGVFFKARRLGGKDSAARIEEIVNRQGIRRSHVLQVVFGLTIINLLIFGFAAYHGFHYTESREFCGELCHVVMNPELNAYQRSPHSEIHCVECHIGSGATWFVKSKLSGMRQVYAVLTDNFSRPIKTPVHNLRPARDVCEVCHRPEIFHGNRIRVIEAFAQDLENTHTYTVLNMRIGGGGEGVPAQGIHWHVSRKLSIRYYASDERREKIDWVCRTDADGSQQVWTRPEHGGSESHIDSLHIRTMDCLDCHNRPTHIYLPPDKALNDWMARKKIDPAIPWIRKLGEEVLTRDYATSEEARQGIEDLAHVYREREPEAWEQYREPIKTAIGQLHEIYNQFVYPEMKIRWNTYPTLIGHPTPHTAACFRCHDGVLRTETGKPITTECQACHHIIARQERDPVIVRMLEAE